MFSIRLSEAKENRTGINGHTPVSMGIHWRAWDGTAIHWHTPVYIGMHGHTWAYTYRNTFAYMWGRCVNNCIMITRISVEADKRRLGAFLRYSQAASIRSHVKVVLIFKIISKSQIYYELQVAHVYTRSELTQKRGFLKKEANMTKRLGNEHLEPFYTTLRHPRS